MSLAADALQPFAVKVLFTLSGRLVHHNLLDVITSNHGAGFDLNFDSVTTKIGIDFREPNYIGAAMGGDALRFASSAFVSVNALCASIEERSSCAWSMIRLYYGAFYAAHSVLRLLGQSCSQLDAAHVTRLRNLANAQGLTIFPIQKGVYHCVMNAAQTGLNLNPTRNVSGGSHETFWAIFDQFLADTTEEVLLGHLAPLDARAVFSKLQAFRSILRSSGGGSSWLSVIRNDIQYRHGQGVWVPLGITKKTRLHLSRLAKQLTRDPMEVDLELVHLSPPLLRFVAACVFMVALCTALLTRIVQRSSAPKKSFAYETLHLFS